MNTQDLHDLILNNPTYKALADAGSDNVLAETINASLPRIISPGKRIYELDILAAFADPTHGEALLGKLETAALSNPLLKRVISWGKPESVKGIDISNSAVRAMVTQLASLSVITNTERDTLLNLGTEADSVSPKDIADAWAQYRLNGNIVTNDGGL